MASDLCAARALGMQARRCLLACRVCLIYMSFAGCLGCLACLAGLRSAAAAAPVQENDLKAAFVFNFAVFTEWPQEALGAGAPLSLCASVASPLYAPLASLQDKLVNGHRIAVRGVDAHSQERPGQERLIRSCHVLVLDHSDRERWPQLRRDLAGGHVLTVTDDHGLAAAGTVIAFSAEDTRIGFDVDLGAARAARLTLSSKLLRLARSVQ
jgi:hypothetical protein